MLIWRMERLTDLRRLMTACSCCLLRFSNPGWNLDSSSLSDIVSWFQSRFTCSFQKGDKQKAMQVQEWETVPCHDLAVIQLFAELMSSPWLQFEIEIWIQDWLTQSPQNLLSQRRCNNRKRVLANMLQSCSQSRATGFILSFTSILGYSVPSPLAKLVYSPTTSQEACLDYVHWGTAMIVVNTGSYSKSGTINIHILETSLKTWNLETLHTFE